MSNIQKSINQMLYTSTVAAGLYSRSPMGQSASAKRMAAKAASAKEEAIKKGDASVAEAAAVEEQSYLSRAAAVNPTYANLSAANMYDERKDIQAIKHLYDRDRVLVDQKEYFRQLKDAIKNKEESTEGGIE